MVARCRGARAMSEFVYSFEKLRVWNGARELCKSVYQATKGFPRAELYGMTSQMNRAAVSVVADLAEGTSRISRKDQALFTPISYGSLTELACLAILAADVSLLPPEREAAFRPRIDAIARQLIALGDAQLRS